MRKNKKIIKNIKYNKSLYFLTSWFLSKEMRTGK